MRGRRAAPLPWPAWALALLVAAAWPGCTRSPERAPSGWPAPPDAAYAPPPAAHVTRSGETVCAIAGRYGIAPDALLRANGLSGAPAAPLERGRRLRLPDDAPLHHRVRPGETLSGLAAGYGVSVAELARANGLADRDLLFAGARLRIPPGAADGCAPGGRDAPAAVPMDALAAFGAADALLDEARELYRAADFVGAIERAAAADHELEALEGSPSVRRRRAQSAWIAAAAWAGLGRREEALDRFAKVLELDPAVAEEEPASPRLQDLIDEARERRRRP